MQTWYDRGPGKGFPKQRLSHGYSLPKHSCPPLPGRRRRFGVAARPPPRERGHPKVGMGALIPSGARAKTYPNTPDGVPALASLVHRCSSSRRHDGIRAHTRARAHAACTRVRDTTATVCLRSPGPGFGPTYPPYHEVDSPDAGARSTVTRVHAALDATR